MDSSWLRQVTGRDAQYWVHRIQALIVEHSTPPAEEDAVSDTGDIQALKGHGGTETQKVFYALLDEVFACMPPINPTYGLSPYDENMRAMSMVGMICSIWYSTVQQAKCYDSHRPSPIRQSAMQRFQQWRLEMFSYLTDCQLPPDCFSGQPWNHPYDPQAKSGTFL